MGSSKKFYFNKSAERLESTVIVGVAVLFCINSKKQRMKLFSSSVSSNKQKEAERRRI